MPTNHSPQFAANAAVRAVLEILGDIYHAELVKNPEHADKIAITKPAGAKQHRAAAMTYLGNACCYCRVSFDQVAAEREHLVPMNEKFGGLHTWRNVLFTCAKCNQERQSLSWEEFAEKKANGSKALIENWIIKFSLDDRPYCEAAIKSSSGLYRQVIKLVESSAGQLVMDLRKKGIIAEGA